MKKLKEAMCISKDYEFGTAFDLDLQEKKRLQKLADKEELKREKKKAKKEAKKAIEKEVLMKQVKQFEEL
jgi:hypothetical protein